MKIFCCNAGRLDIDLMENYFVSPPYDDEGGLIVYIAARSYGHARWLFVQYLEAQWNIERKFTDPMSIRKVGTRDLKCPGVLTGSEWETARHYYSLDHRKEQENVC